jgi:hypothetical protein
MPRSTLAVAALSINHNFLFHEECAESPYSGYEISPALIGKTPLDLTYSLNGVEDTPIHTMSGFIGRGRSAMAITGFALKAKSAFSTRASRTVLQAWFEGVMISHVLVTDQTGFSC